jgi:hypothetical protein
MSDMTIEGVTRVMKETVKAVEDADVPDDLRAAAFEKAFDVLVGRTAAEAKPSAEVTPPIRRGGPEGGPALGGIASRMSLDAELVNEVFYVDGESFGLALASSRFERSKAPATQQIALLVAAGRQAGGWDEWTRTSEIRDVVREYGRFDPANFATTVRRMADVFSFRGKGRELEVRVTRPGFERAGDLIRELGGQNGV